MRGASRMGLDGVQPTMTTKRAFVLGLILLMCGAQGYAQTQPPVVRVGSILAWDQGISPQETILPPAYEYRLVVDNQPDVALTATCNVAPTNKLLYLCEAPLPPLATGTHEIKVFARITVSGVRYPSDLSDALNVLSLLIEIPRNLHLKQPGL